MRNKLLRFAAKVACFSLITAVAYQWLGATQDMPDSRVPDYFPVVVAMPDSDASGFRLVRWHELKRFRSEHPNTSVRLPAGTFSFTLPPEQEFVPEVRFTATTFGTDQRVELKLHDDDYVTEAVYSVIADSPKPERIRMWHAMTLLAAVIVGLIGTRIVFSLIARVRGRSDGDRH